MKKVIPADSVLIPEQAKLAFKGMIFDVYQWPQVMFDGSEHTFEMLKRPDTVSVIGIADGQILVLDDEQPHSGSRKCFPGGRVDETDASIQAAVARETLEETGYSFKNWRLVKVWQPHTKIEWFIHLFIAWDVVDKQPTAHDAGEKITIHQIPFEEAKGLVINKSTYLAEATSIFENLANLEQLQAVPEFQGQTVDR